jgi:hypothetical protein
MSANPPESRLTHPFEGARNFPGVPYSRLCNSQDVTTFLRGRIDSLVQGFCSE